MVLREVCASPEKSDMRMGDGGCVQRPDYVVLYT